MHPVRLVLPVRLLGVGVLIWSAGCRAEEVTEPTGEVVVAPGRPPQFLLGEPELLGNVYDSAAASNDTTLYVHLVPLDSLTTARLSVTNFDSTIWVNPEEPTFSFSYFAPPAGAECGGSYSTFLSGDEENLGAEVHASGPSQNVPNQPEAHCIIPGRYEIRLVSGVGETPTVLESFPIDYVASATPGGTAVTAMTVDDQILGIEEANWSPANHTWNDIVINFHLHPSGSYSDSAHLEIENAQANQYKTIFSPAANPTGSSSDWFRFRTDQSTSTWSHDSRGESLVRIYHDTEASTFTTGFFDPEFGDRPVSPSTADSE